MGTGGYYEGAYGDYYNSEYGSYKNGYYGDYYDGFYLGYYDGYYEAYYDGYHDTYTAPETAETTARVGSSSPQDDNMNSFESSASVGFKLTSAAVFAFAAIHMLS